MKIKTISCLVLAGMLSLNSCVKGDIDELQNQINDLNEKVNDLESTQQEALLAAIAKLEADLAALNSELVGDLELLEQEIANNANAVYYGNVITDEDYAALTAQGATIITGRVVVGGDAHVSALSTIKLIGKSLEVNGGTTITMDALQSIGENLIIEGVEADATVNFAVLASIGGDFEVVENAGLTSVVADELVLISGALATEESEMLATLSLAKLDQVGELSIDNYYADDPTYINIGALSNLDLSGTNVLGDAHLNYLGDVEVVSLGDIHGNFDFVQGNVVKLSISGETVDGNFTLSFNKRLKTVETPNLKSINGSLDISGNSDWQLAGASLEALPSFPALEFIGGNVTIGSNSDLVSIDAFNNVTQLTGDISLSESAKIESVNIFNALVETGANQWSNANIYISFQTNWFNGFNELLEAGEVTITVKVPSADDGGIGISSTSSASALADVAKMEGFAKLTESTNMQLYFSEVTEFNAFASYTNFKRTYGTGFKLQMPAEGIGMCAMEPFLTKVKNGDFGTKPMVFEEMAENEWGWMVPTEVDKDTAVDRLLAPCTTP
ncbi:hypothetical protein KFZ70_16375 [Tamlana fucoidanivorans]|uniref:Receptor L-domain domain-containing protein n=1 Tax=Allotamlana fucoidanivorans TaxID=2583814 RepID=A0A5C4SIH3_9FLAO|nr:hypothetical protein [Tamlana fucoidanivorans]TNJ42884.1 hypothetical protein FGF67_12915 [Tamlana fucoidanivorans]